jgi:superfamily I DNA and/or RNA helicase
VGIAEITDEGNYQIASAYRETRNHEGKIVERLRVGTVDAFQGKEFDVVFLSITRSNDINPVNEELYPKKYGFLMLENRLCVAMSRQQRLLITVGDLEMVKAENAPLAVRELVDFYQLCQQSDGKII